MKLWIDDLRPAPIGYDLVARNSIDACQMYLDNHAHITHISFDHDLGEVNANGEELNGNTVLLFIEECLYFGTTTADALVGLQLHSSNSAVVTKMMNGFNAIKQRHNHGIIIHHSPYESLGECDGFGFKLQKGHNNDKESSNTQID